MQYTQKKGNTKLYSLQNHVATVKSIESQSEKNEKTHYSTLNGNNNITHYIVCCNAY